MLLSGHFPADRDGDRKTPSEGDQEPSLRDTADDQKNFCDDRQTVLTAFSSFLDAFYGATALRADNCVVIKFLSAFLTKLHKHLRIVF